MPYFLLAIFIGVSLVINQAAISLILGILFSVIKNRHSLSAVNVNGTNFLKAGIVLLGGTISLSSVSEISVNYLPLVSFYVLMVFLVGFLLGRILKVSQKHLILLVAGTAICGGTAIASLAPIIKSKTEELVSSISLVFLLNLFAIIAFPFIGEAIGLSQKQFGIFAALLFPKFRWLSVGIIVYTLAYLIAVYIAYLGCLSFFSTSRSNKDKDVRKNENHFGAYILGLITNILNPKAILFFVTVYTAVVNESTTKPLLSFYGLYMSVTTFIWFSCISYIFSNQTMTNKYQNFFPIFEKVIGIILIIIAIQLFL